MDRLDVMRLFVRVADTGSFSMAARGAGIGQPTVSKQIAGLETRLGAQLLRRTSRGLSLTQAGQDFYQSSVRLLDDFDAAEAQIGRDQAAPAGLVRVAMSAGFGRMFLMPRLPEFFRRFPDVSVDLDVSERQVNLIEEGIDVAIRIGRLIDSSLIARRIGSVEIATVATPDYLDRFGTPEVPGDLERHACVIFVSRGGARNWEFKGPSGPIVRVPVGPVRTNDAEHIRAAVLAGLGVGNTPSWLFADELCSGAAKRILTDYEPEPFPIHAVFPGGRRVSAKTKVFTDFIAEIFTESDWLKIR